MRALQQALAGATAALLLLALLARSAYGFLQAEARAHTAALRASCARDARFAAREYVPQTGDLVLLQHVSTGLQAYRGMGAVPTHVGLVWIRAGTACLIEATRFTDVVNDDASPAIRQRAPAPDGVRVVALTDALHARQGLAFAAVRPLTAGRIDGAQLDAVLRSEWARVLRFEPAVGDDMSALELMALGIEPAFPRVARAAAMLSGLHRPERNGSTVFCSEFVAHVLQKLGHIRDDFAEHWLLAPIHFTRSVGRIDALAAGAAQPLAWGAERALACLPSLA